MTDLPSYSGMTPEQAFERLQAWYQKNAQLKTLKTHEHLERVALAEYYFPQANEGTNRLPLGGGFDLKLQHGYRYIVTDEDLDQVAAKDIKRLKLPWDDLFVYKPELKLSEYRKLTPEQKAFVDAILTIKPASPQLEIVPVANTEAQQAHIEAAEQAASGKAAPPSPEEGSSADDEALEVVLDAEQAEAGQYFSDGETWWYLTEDIEWEEVEEAELIEALDLRLLAVQEEAEAAKPRRGRPRKAKQG